MCLAWGHLHLREVTPELSLVSTKRFGHDRSMDVEVSAPVAGALMTMRPPSHARLNRAVRQLDIPCEAEQHQQPQQQISQIDLPPMPLIGGRTGLGMVIVVPALAAGEDGDPG